MVVPFGIKTTTTTVEAARVKVIGLEVLHRSAMGGSIMRVESLGSGGNNHSSTTLSCCMSISSRCPPTEITFYTCVKKS